jgi:antitoxin component YwqK of YwqJK toxin-antitoxin module
MGKCYYKNDKKVGEYILYYENGKIMEKYYYKNDKKIEIKSANKFIYYKIIRK